MKPHPLCSCIPEMSDADYAALKADIAEHGLREKIVLYDGMILDGRNRYRACQETHTSAVTVNGDFTDANEAAAFVLSKNLKRRHMTPSQISAALAAIDDFLLSANEYQNNKPPTGGKSVTNTERQGRPELPTTKAAKAAGVSVRSMERARAVKRDDPEVFEEVKAGKKTLRAAEKEIKAAAMPVEMPTVDEVGHKIPKELATEFMIATGEMQDLQAEIMRARRHLTKIMEQPWSAYVDQSVGAALSRAWSGAKFARPYTICPYCGGDKCKACKGRGWMPKDVFDRVPKELKNEPAPVSG